MKALYLSSIVAVACVACACMAPGCTDLIVPASGGDDAGSGPDATTPGANDSGTGQVADGGSGSSLSLPDGAIPPSGTLIVPSPSASLYIIGVTSDDFVVYLDTSTVTPTVYAISLAAGSKPVALGLADQNDNVVVAGRVVLFENDGNKKGVGRLSAWTSTAAAAAGISTHSCSAVPQSGMYAASPDGKYVLYFDDVDTDCETGTLTVAATDGSSKTSLVTSVDLTGAYCGFMLAFAGDTAVAGYCVTSAADGALIDASLEDGGTTIDVATVSAFSPPSWGQVPLVVGAQPGIVTDPSLAQVILIGPNGTAAYPLDGGAPVTIDPNGELGALGATPGLLADDGGVLVYTTVAEALDRSATTSPPTPAPAQLAGVGTFADVLAISPNQQWVIGTLNTGDYPAIDLYLASITTPGPLTALSSTTTATLYGDAFTADSSRALYLTAINSNGSGTLVARPIAGGSPTVLNAAALADFSPSGTKVVIDGNLDSNDGVADILVADVSSAAAPKVLVSLADLYPTMNMEKTTVLYTWSYDPGPSSGLWALPVP
jgi:hypothetical protein